MEKSFVNRDLGLRGSGSASKSSISKGFQGSANGKGGSGVATVGSSMAVDSVAGGGGEGEEGGGGERERLLGWRDELVGSGMYTEDNPIVKELSRRIALAAGQGGGLERD